MFFPSSSVASTLSASTSECSTSHLNMSSLAWTCPVGRSTRRPLGRCVRDGRRHSAGSRRQLDVGTSPCCRRQRRGTERLARARPALPARRCQACRHSSPSSEPCQLGPNSTTSICCRSAVAMDLCRTTCCSTTNQRKCSLCRADHVNASSPDRLEQDRSSVDSGTDGRPALQQELEGLHHARKSAGTCKHFGQTSRVTR